MADLGNVEYYTAKEVAEIEGVNPKTIKVRCQEGKYPGAYKSAPTADNPSGTWFIPRNLVGLIKDVAIINKSNQLTTEDFLNSIADIVRPLNEKIESQAQRIEQLENMVNATYTAVDTVKKEFRDFITETRAERKAKEKPWYKFWE